LSLQSHLDGQRDALETLESRDRRRSLSTTQAVAMREALLADSYLFTRYICGHKDLVPALHMPLSYMATGQIDNLITVLNAKEFDSYVTRKLRSDLWGRNPVIDWKTPEGYRALDELLEFINIRWFRDSFKSSTITHGGVLCIATNDPNETIKITHAVDDKAWAFCSQIGETMLSGRYIDIFPDRIPKGDLTKLVTMKEITLGGRTISHPQTTIQAGGYKTKDEGAHYSTYVTDDLVVKENSSSIELKGVHRWLRGLPGTYMPTRRIRRIHAGTRHEEGDDHDFLTKGELAKICLSLVVPIEEHEGGCKNIMVRGKPTIPQLFPKEKITKKQAHVLSDETDPDGVFTWRCDYLLDPTAGGARLFPPHLVDDRDHWYLGKYEHPNDAARRAGRFLVARYARDEEGKPLAKPGKSVHDAKGELLPQWRDNAKVLSFDPWRDLFTVALVDPAWADSSDKARTSRRDPDNWAVSSVGADYEMVKFQLETRSERTGQEGWIEELNDMDLFYHFRVIGIDAHGMQDAIIKNLMQTDPRLRRMRSRIVPVSHPQASKRQHMKAGLAEPLAMYQYLLDPTPAGNDTREELKAIKGSPNDTDGRADSLSMAPAVLRRAPKPKTDEERAKERQAELLSRNYVDPYLGVPMVA
jgi:hypothetical protein